MKIKWFIIPVLWLMCWTCTTLHLENQLKKQSPDIAKWYEVHSILMEGRVPKWLDEHGGSERKHFLRLPRKMQIVYTHYFWKIRRGGLEESYYYRLAVAKRFYGGWRTDMGYIYILCGQPMNIRYVRNPTASGGSEADIEGNQYQLWFYMYGGHGVEVVFVRRWDEWQLIYGSLRMTGNLTRLIEYNKKVFRPTEEGWEMWGNTLLQWLKKRNDD